MVIKLVCIRGGEFELCVSEDSDYIIIETKSRCEGESECFIWKSTVKISNNLTHNNKSTNILIIKNRMTKPKNNPNKTQQALTLFGLVVFKFTVYLYIWKIHPFVSKFLDSEPGSFSVGLSREIIIVLLVSILIEAIGFAIISTSSIKKYLIFVITIIPRLFLYLELFRLVYLSSVDGITLGGSLLVFVFAILLIVIEYFFFTLLTEFKLFKKNKIDFSNLIYIVLTIPLYCLWYSIFEIAYLPQLVDAGQWFIFFGVYSVFMFLPLHIPWIIISTNHKLLNIFSLILLVVEMAFVYINVYNNIF